MVQVALALMLALTNDGTETLKYEQAFAKAQEEKKPLVVMVGARWCAACQIMKRDTIEPMSEAGELEEVVITYVDKDERPELAEQLMKGQTLPQVIMYCQEPSGWKRFSLKGMQSRGRMGELLGRAITLPTRTLR